MSRSLLLVLFCAAAGASPIFAADLQSSNVLTPEEKRAGWILLFDGRSMNGWDDPSLKTPPGDAWSIEDGCLKAHAHPHITEDLFTQKTLHDFELVFDWRISLAGNSGVKYRIQRHLFVTPLDRAGQRETFEQSVDRRRALRHGGAVGPTRPARG